MNTHTPGPWLLSDDQTYITAHDGGTLVCETTVQRWRNLDAASASGGKVASRMIPQSIADARLIASAPDLLEAVESLLLSPDLCWDELEPATYKAIETARAAIAKAKGDR